MYEASGIAKARVKEIDPLLVRELLDYQKDSGLLLWRARSEKMFSSPGYCTAWNKSNAGKSAGSQRTKGGRSYINITIFGSDFSAHRLAWAWMTGRQPPYQIDHIDGNSLNNTWDNLRDGSGVINNRNSKRSKANTSGASGVVWNRSAGKWQAQVNAGGKNHYLGVFEDIDEAAEVARRFRYELGFTERHGEI